MAHDDLREFQERPVLYVQTLQIPDAIPRIFHELEVRLPTMRRRRFYGVMFRDRYWAAVERTPEDDPAKLGLLTGAIPAGAYVCRSLRDWSHQTLAADVPLAFQQMLQGREPDMSRPFIEFYRSESQLILQAPVKT